MTCYLIGAGAVLAIEALLIAWFFWSARKGGRQFNQMCADDNRPHSQRRFK